MESGHEKTHPTANLGKNDHLTPGKTLISSSSSSSSEDSFQDADDISKSTLDTTNHPKHDKDTHCTPEYSGEDIPISSMPSHAHSIDGPEGHSLEPEDPSHTSESSSSDGSEKELPPMQVMDRTDDSTTSDTYRIPSYVFARNKSAAPMEWSVASNESLFSIHMGNMSFTKEYASWMKSGELVVPGDSTFSGPLMDLSNIHPPTNKSTDTGQENKHVNGGFGITEAEAAETMREVIRENEDGSSKGKVPTAKDRRRSSTSLSHRSDESGTSVRSFAFPVLAADGHGDKSGSSMGGTEKHKKQSRTQSQRETPKVASGQVEPEPQKSQTPKSNSDHSKWLSCFPCCPSSRS